MNLEQKLRSAVKQVTDTSLDGALIIGISRKSETGYDYFLQTAARDDNSILELLSIQMMVQTIVDDPNSHELTVKQLIARSVDIAKRNLKAKNEQTH